MIIQKETMYVHAWRRSRHKTGRVFYPGEIRAALDGSKSGSDFLGGRKMGWGKAIGGTPTDFWRKFPTVGPLLRPRPAAAGLAYPPGPHVPLNPNLIQCVFDSGFHNVALWKYCRSQTSYDAGLCVGQDTLHALRGGVQCCPAAV